MTIQGWSAPVAVQVLDQAVREIEAAIPGSVDRRSEVCLGHANTWTWIAPQPPDAVVYPRSTRDVCKIVKIARRLRVPVIPFGGGTSLEGHVNAPFGGISLDLGHMNHIGPFNARDFTVRVQSGLRLADLNRYLDDKPVMFSVDPGAGEATVGGLAATRASGTNTVRFGTMRENTHSLEVVLSDGSVVETATGAPKSAAGYDLTNLMIGSEGTLGVITALTLRLHPRPKNLAVCVVPFPSVNAACQMVMDVMARGVRPARVELLDALMIETVNVHANTDWEVSPTLFLEVHGTPSQVKEVQDDLEQASKTHGGGSLEFGTESQARERLWQARHDAFRALSTRWPKRTVLASDVCVPVSKLATAIGKAQANIADLGLIAPIVGHVGDGNFHVLPVFDDADEQARRTVRTLLDRLADIAYECGGTCSGEHGIGQGKKAYLAREAGSGIAVMTAIKSALDPDNILNPGKLF